MCWGLAILGAYFYKPQTRTSGFYWGRQCSWTLTSVNSIEASNIHSFWPYHILFKKWVNPGPFSFIFGLFKQTVQFLQQINVKNDHPIYGAGIWTHNLPNMSRHP